MTDRRGTWISFGEGALVGLAVGAILGWVRMRWAKELSQGTPLVAAWTVLTPIVVAGACAAALSVTATPMIRTIGRDGSRSARRIALGVLFCVACAWSWAVSGPFLEVMIPIPYPTRPKLVAALAGLLAAAGAGLAGLRALDLLRNPPFPRSRSVVAAIGLLGLVAAGLAGTTLAGLDARRSRGRPNVLIVCLDTMRADALGALGGHGRTPLLDRLASQGVLFEQATSAAPWTLPAHVSLFTSRLPFDHGTRFSMHRIDPSRLMLAERFRDAGFRTAGFTGDAYVDGHFGFDQGFDRYDDFHEDLESGPAPIADAALRWIRGGGRRPFFAFVHTYEPHSPYSEPGFADPADREGLPEIFENDLVQRIHDGELVLSERQRRWVRGLYAGDVARADRVLGGMLEALRQDGILDETILVVLSDHGEDFWDHDDRRSPGHGHSLYQELLHVPLFFRAPGIARSGARVRTPVSLLDVAPTLLELCGLAVDHRIQGRSLARSVREGVEPPAAPVWSESVEYGPDRFSVREGRWKAILTPPGGYVHGDYRPVVRPLEVFDLEIDRDETVDRSAEANDVVVRLVRMLTEHTLGRAGERPAPGLEVDPDDALRETLRSLGYVE